VNFGDARLPARFWDKVAPCPMSGCWLWTARLDDGYGRFLLDGRTRLAYNVTYEVETGDVAPAGFTLDHRCRVRSCVNPSHLRLATKSQNRSYSGTPCVNTSGYKGVYLRNDRGTWRAQIAYGGRQVIIGTFHSAVEAARAYDAAARVHHLDFALLNFPEESNGSR
jgi:hypothetical protein